MVSDRLKRLFPELHDCEETSPEDPSSNCFAWTVGLGDIWVSPLEYEDYYWPEGVLREFKIESFIGFFGRYGFSVCDDPSLEQGIEKIALYADRNGVPTHASRQLPDGKRTSKLGPLEDITHDLNGLAGSVYGTIKAILKRSVPSA